MHLMHASPLEMYLTLASSPLNPDSSLGIHMTPLRSLEIYLTSYSSRPDSCQLTWNPLWIIHLTLAALQEPTLLLLAFQKSTRLMPALNLTPDNSLGIHMTPYNSPRTHQPLPALHPNHAKSTTLMLPQPTVQEPTTPSLLTTKIPVLLFSLSHLPYEPLASLSSNLMFNKPWL